jgi:hypothetical protein
VTEPTSAHVARYREGHGDGRLTSPTFERNVGPVIDGLSPFLRRLSGNALEIGSGSGQHVCAFARAFPALEWTPSDPDALHRESVRAWRAYRSAPVADPLDIDAGGDWPATEDVQAISPLALVLSLNVIHIAPFAVTRGIVAGAGRTLRRGGLLAFYGPFRENGVHTGEGNRVFDARLRADDPDWGLRDTEEVKALAAAAGLAFEALVPTPANNRILVFRRD